MNPQELIRSHPVLIGVAFSLVFSVFAVGFWCGIVATISFVGGWFELAKKFRFVGAFNGVSDGLQSGQMRSFANYQNCLTLGANEQGLYLAVLFFFRFMHPPLFVPWSEIRVDKKKRVLFGESITFTLGRESGIPLSIRGNSATRLRDAAGTHWPQE